MAKVIIPFPLRKHVANQSEIITQSANLAETMAQLWSSFPQLKETLDDAVLLSVFVNNKMVNVGSANWDTVALNDNDEVALIIPIAGG